MTHKNDAPTILIVDDTPSNLGMVVKLMEDRGYRVSIAQDGEEGLQRAQLLQPDLILLDVMMPGADGFEICQRLKAQENTRDIPVVFMTALASPEHKVKGFAAGGVDYLTKPLHVDEVMARVDTHIKLNTAQRQLAVQNALLEKQRDELEMRVNERTAELGEANRKLREESDERERAYRRMVLLDFALDHVSDDVSLLDQNGKFLYVNEYACREMGHARTELLGMGVTDIDPDWTAERYAEFWPELQKQGTIRLETRHQASDGRIFPVEVNANYFEYEGVGYNLTLVRNITERKRIERELLLLNRALDSSFDAAYLLDADLHFRYVNEAAVRELGYSREELLAMNLTDIDPNVTRKTVQQMMRKTANAGRFPGTVESVHRRKNGETFPIEIGATTFTYEGENLFLTTVRNITERKLTEDALAASEREFRTLAENLPDNLARYDKQCRIVYMNPQLESFLNVKLEERLGQTPLESAPGPIYAEYQAHIAKTIATGQPCEMELTLPDRGAGIRYHHIRIVAERDERGEIIGALTIGRDITERKEADRLLHEQEQAIRAVVENSPDAIARYDRQLRRTYINPATQKLFDLPFEQIQNQTPEEHSPMTADFIQILREVFECGQERHIELPFRKANGEEGWGDLRIVPEFGANGGVVSVLSIGRDITERKRSEDLLREERGLFVGGPTVVFKWKARDGWPVEYVSPNVQEQFGYSADQLTSGAVSFGAIVHPDDIQRVATEVATYTAQGRSSYEQEYRIAHASGDYRWIYDFTIVSRKEDGAVDHYHGYVMDITERKEMENELHEQELRYREIFDNASDGLYLLEQTEDGRFSHLDINPAFVKMRGISREDLIGKCVDEIVSPETAQRVTEKYRRCIAADIPIIEDAELDLPIGRRYFHSTLVPIHNGGPRRIVGITRDVTEIKLVERSLEESRAQLRGLAAKNEIEREEERKYIARSIYDELGQTLAGLQLDVSALSHKFGPALPALSEHVKGTQALVNKSLTSLRNIAAMLRPSSLDMGIVLAIEWVAGRFTDNTGIACEIHVSDADRDIKPGENISIALYRIVYELLTNVSRHAKASRVDISIGQKGRDYILEVKDNGTGFDTGKIKEDSFGLFDIRERVHRLGGQLSVDSTPGSGTAIKVSLPSQ
jgi:PAS domain S-box-containing protein